MSGTNCRVDTSVNEQSRPRETYWVFEKADDCRDAGGRATQDAKADDCGDAGGTIPRMESVESSREQRPRATQDAKADDCRDAGGRATQDAKAENDA